MKLTAFTDYGLRVLLVLTANRDRLFTIAEIADAFDISEAHLMKVTHSLARLNWIETVRGRGGGMQLAIDPRHINLRTIIQALESDFTLVECFGKADRCVLSGGCGLEYAMSRALNAFFRELESHTLEEIATGSSSLNRIEFPIHRRA